MKTFVLCGGLGTRLRPLTLKTPKPMLLVGGKPILFYVIDNLRKNGFVDIVLTVGYLNEQMKDYFGDGKKFGVKIEYLIEKERLNTAGSILPFNGKLKETFAVVMGDHLTNVNMKKMLEFHKKSGAIVTIALQTQKLKIDYGVVDIDNDKVAAFREKPVLEHLINTGMYICEPQIFDYIKEKEDFAHDVFPRLLKQGKKIAAYHLPDEWFDIGRLSDYENAGELLKRLNL
ncbi:MAG: sugar phosphate nucleotidyltransferase [Candidatus Micrarchaeota archaeon]|nr:sugar phosphate nucleotidyltransferase [Candidatus Micrarchaeota archaeon]